MLFILKFMCTIFYFIHTRDETNLINFQFLNIFLYHAQHLLEEFKKSTCYITQDDRLQLLLTVFENMKVAADLKLGDNVTEAEKKSRVSSNNTNDTNMTCFVRMHKHPSKTFPFIFFAYAAPTEIPHAKR